MPAAGPHPTFKDNLKKIKKKRFKVKWCLLICTGRLGLFIGASAKSFTALHPRARRSGLQGIVRVNIFAKEQHFNQALQSVLLENPKRFWNTVTIKE